MLRRVACLIGALGTLLLIVFAPHGCTTSPCTQAGPAIGAPSVSFECPGGELCYQGQCLRSCSAGAEHFVACDVDDECDDAARPRCLDGFCSACDAGETCIPNLNICQAVTDILAGDPPQGGAFDPRDRPLDGGTIDGSVLTRDAAADGEPVPLPVTHRGAIDIAQITDLRGNVAVESASIAIDLRDLRSAVLTDTAGVVFSNTPCEVNRLDGYASAAAPLRADLGRIRIEPGMFSPAAIRGAPYTATRTSSTGRYGIVPAVTNSNLLGFSTLTPQSQANFIAVFGEPMQGLTLGPWPDPEPSFGGYHVPFELRPNAATRALLDAGVIVSDRDNPPDISVGWERINGVTEGEAVLLRIAGSRHELRCIDREGTNGQGAITVFASVLSAFMQNEPMAPETELELIVERALEQTISIPSNISQGINIRVSIRIRHSFVSKIRFR